MLVLLAFLIALPGVAVAQVTEGNEGPGGDKKEEASTPAGNGNDNALTSTDVVALITALGALIGAIAGLLKTRNLDSKKVNTSDAEEIAQRATRKFIHDLLDHPTDAEDLRKVGGMAGEDDLRDLQLEVQRLKGWVRQLESLDIESSRTKPAPRPEQVLDSLKDLLKGAVAQ